MDLPLCCSYTRGCVHCVHYVFITYSADPAHAKYNAAFLKVLWCHPLSPMTCSHPKVSTVIKQKPHCVQTLRTILTTQLPDPFRHHALGNTEKRDTTE